jgi:hypothetical protein
MIHHFEAQSQIIIKFVEHFLLTPKHQLVDYR